MKTTKRLLSCLLVLAMMFALAIPAFADDTPVGTITIKNTEKDQTYTLYKLFDAVKVGEGDNAGYSYTVASGVNKDLDFTDSPFVISAGHASLKKGETDVSVAGWLASNYSKLEQVTGVTNPQTSTEGKDITFTGLPYGYYVIVRSNGTTTAANVGANTLSGPDVVIFDKNTDGSPIQPVDPENPAYKTVDGQKTVSADLGDNVDFKVEFNTSNYGDNPEYENNYTVDPYLPVTSYEIVDIPTGITIDWSKLKIEVNGTTIENATGESDKYIVDETGKKITVIWNANGAPLYAEGAKLTITYTGKVTEKDASNKVEITPYLDKKPGTPDKTDPEVVVKSTDIVVKKTDKEGTALEGAEFTLSKNDNGSIVYYRYNTNDGKVEWVDNVTTKADVKVSAAGTGMLSFKGLAEGTYTLTETKAPNGYNQLTESITLTIKFGEDGKQLLVTNGEDIFNESAPLSVINERGTVLPSTGGIGTTMFYVIGGILVAAAVVVLVSKKRMGAEQ